MSSILNLNQHLLHNFSVLELLVVENNVRQTKNLFKEIEKTENLNIWR
jgi:hypothetical protein